MSKELKFEFNDYIVAIDEPYENDCGYVAIGKKDKKDGINIWFKSLNQQTVNFYIELQKYIADLEAKLAEERKHICDEIREKSIHTKTGYMGITQKGYFTIYAGNLEQIERRVSQNAKNKP